MKIAVLLRGQPRFSDYGAKFFQKFVQERFPEHEFNIFIATWKSVSNVMAKPYPVDSVIYGREYDQKMLSLEDTIELIKPWSSRKFLVLFEKELFNLLKEIYTSLLLNKELYNALEVIIDSHEEEVNGKNLLVPGHLDVVFKSEEFLVTNLIWGNKLELADPVYELKRSMINNQYLLGQIYSACRSYDIFESYSIETGYEPDLIWSSRLDMIHWYNSPECFDVIKKDLENMDSDNNIFVDRVEIHKSKPWASDYNFYMLPKTAKDSLSNVDDKFKDWFLKNPMLVLSALGSGPALQHVLWANFFNKCILKPLNPFIKPAHSEVIRPVENLDKLVEQTLASPSTLKTVSNFVEGASHNWPYPGANTPVPNELTDKYYEILSNN